MDQFAQRLDGFIDLIVEAVLRELASETERELAEEPRQTQMRPSNSAAPKPEIP